MTERQSIGEGSPALDHELQEKTGSDYFSRRKALIGQLSALYDPYSSHLPLDMPIASEDELLIIAETAALKSNKGIKRLIRQRKAAVEKHRRRAGPDQRWPILL
jgi:hypothetical protein